MKSCTDLKQSRKLAEILPLESADMRIGNYIGKSGKVDGTNIHYYHKSESFGAPEIINAWSFAALLDVLPSAALVSSNDHYYRLRCMKRFTEWYDNPVDACVAMIEKLHKSNLL